MEPWEVWVRSTDLSKLVLSHPALWQVMETLHYFGLTLLFGTVGLFDLRLLGVAKPIPPAALHRLIPWGIAGFFLNVLTGIAFFSGYPEQYAYNSAFHLKLAAMTLAGANAALFYVMAFGDVKHLGAGVTAPLKARVVAGISLGSWLLVLSCGRLLTFFRPPFFH
jgi:hypothetical protein